VQFTDWDNGDRVIVNFADQPFAIDGNVPVPGRSFIVRKSK
jgi:hypothetical protein